LALRPIAIGGLDDRRLDDFRDLTDAELRRRVDNPVFIAEGLHVIRQLLGSSYPVRSLLLTEGKLERLAPDLEGLDPHVPVYVAPPQVLDGIAGFHVHRGALAAAARKPLPSAVEILVGARLVLILEAINDHENLGALFRNAAAFGADAVLLCPHCADPLYRRSIRVSLGHVLHVPFARVEAWPDDLQTVEAVGLRIMALTPDRAAVPLDQVAPTAATPTTATGVAILVGAEGPGLSPQALAAAGLAVRIPIVSGVDSLNVATAAAIALHRLAPDL
jgi:tRNA G18 (ribose-2'-O)-methylase SpoU